MRARFLALTLVLATVACKSSDSGSDASGVAADAPSDECVRARFRYADRACAELREDERGEEPVCADLEVQLATCKLDPPAATSRDAVAADELTPTRLCDLLLQPVDPHARGQGGLFGDPDAYCHELYSTMLAWRGAEAFAELAACKLQTPDKCAPALVLDEAVSEEQRRAAIDRLSPLCEQHPDCADYGYCDAGILSSLTPEAHYPWIDCVTTREGCKATKACERLGWCSPVWPYGCGVGEGDCQASKVCTKHGLCAFVEVKSGFHPEPVGQCVSPEEAAARADGRPWVSYRIQNSVGLKNTRHDSHDSWKLERSLETALRAHEHELTGCLRDAMQDANANGVLGDVIVELRISGAGRIQVLESKYREPKTARPVKMVAIPERALACFERRLESVSLPDFATKGVGKLTFDLESRAPLFPRHAPTELLEGVKVWSGPTFGLAPVPR